MDEASHYHSNMRLPMFDPAPEVGGDASAGLAEVLAAIDASIEGDVRGDRLTRGLFSTDASPYAMTPLAVVTPRNAEDVAETMRICAARGVPVLPRGGGTSLAGQTVNTAVVLDFTRFMNRVLEIDAEARVARVQPGLVLDDLRRALESHGLAFGPDVSTSTHATLGGMIGNASAGSYSLVHGMTDEHVLALDVVLADGTANHLGIGNASHGSAVASLRAGLRAIVEPLRPEIEARFPRVRRNVAGYRLDDLLAMYDRSEPGTDDAVNLGRFLAGSEGSLAITTAASVRLVEPPGGRSLLVLAFSEVAAACAVVETLVASGPAAVELMDRHIIDAAARQAIFAADVELLPTTDGRRAAAVLYVEYHAKDVATADEMARAGMIAAGVPEDAGFIVRDPATQARLWSVRTTGLGLISKVSGSVQPMAGLEDCGVPLERLSTFQPAFEGLIRSHGWSGVFYAHASVGLLHVRPRIDLASQLDRDAFLRLREETLELVLEHGGSISGEHGDGRIRTDLVHRMYGPAIVEGLGAIKKLFDPSDLLNPGNKIVARDPLADLRFDRDAAKIDPDEAHFEWPAGGPLAEARACNGNGLCRRSEGGAMCPSYRALRDERHSTRGRANTLGLALDGRLAEGESASSMSALGREDVLKTLDLCLSCKACRHECPSNVDLSKLKSEYLAQSFDAAGVIPFRTRVLGRAGLLLRRAARTPRLVRWLAGLPGSTSIIARLLGLDPTRPLPRPARRDRRVFTSTAATDAPAVVLLGDCFNATLEPDHLQDARRLLDAFGYRVIPVTLDGCCGRPQISAGLLREARRLVERSAPSLHATIRAHEAVAVIALEPSCLSALREEWRELRSDVPDSTTEVIADRATSIECFLDAAWDDHPKRPGILIPEGATVHPHCHAKVERGAFRRLFDRLDAVDAVVLDSGCCGLAGSFGYVAEHAGLSRRIFEQSLGEVIADRRDGPVVASGTSCRHQCGDLADIQAVHPISLLAEGLETPADQD